MAGIPWWATILIQVAVKFGLAALIKKWPSIPQWLVDAIDKLISGLKDPNIPNTQAHAAFTAVCAAGGVGCPPDLK